MPRWFIRHEGKVFGPFDDARLRFLLDAKRFNDTAEYGQSWEGPWRPLLDTLKGNGSSLPKATPPSLSAAVQKPPPVGEVRSSAPGVTAEQRRQAATSASVTDAFFVEEKPQEDRPLVDPGLRLRRATLQQRRQATTHHVVAAMLALLVAVVSAVAALVITGSPVIRQFIPGRRIQVPTEKRRPNTRAGIEAAPKPGRPTVSSSAANFKPLQRPEENDTFGTGTWPNDRSAQSTSQASVQQPPPPPNIPAEPEEDTDDTRQLLRDPQHCMAEFNRPAFDPDLIDVAKLRSVAEDLRGRFVVEENRETVEDFLEVTRNRESKSSTGRKEWGGVIRFEPGGAHFRNEKGDAPWSLDELAGSSQTALEQIAKRAKEVFELTERLT